MDNARPDDKTFAHEGRAVLAIDKPVFESLANIDGQFESMPAFTKITRQHMDAWYGKVDNEFNIPEEHRNYFRKKINSKYEKNKSAEEHYGVLADPMQQALERVFHGKKDN